MIKLDQFTEKQHLDTCKNSLLPAENNLLNLQQNPELYRLHCIFQKTPCWSPQQVITCTKPTIQTELPTQVTHNRIHFSIMNELLQIKQNKHFYEQITKVIKKGYKRLSLMIRSVMKLSQSTQSSSSSSRNSFWWKRLIDLDHWTRRGFFSFWKHNVLAQKMFRMISCLFSKTVPNIYRQLS